MTHGNLINRIRWHEGRSMKNGAVFLIGVRREYFDYSF